MIHMDIDLYTCYELDDMFKAYFQPLIDYQKEHDLIAMCIVAQSGD